LSLDSTGKNRGGIHCWLYRHLESDPCRALQSSLSRRLLRAVLHQRGQLWDEQALELPGVALRSALRAAIGIDISISHSRNWVGVCLAPVSVGLDLEAPGRERDWLAIADTFFTASEARQLARVEGVHRKALFLRYWTLKESCIKAAGGGVFDGLNQLRVVAGDRIELAPGADSVTVNSVWSARYRDLVLGVCSTAAWAAPGGPQFWHCSDLQEFVVEPCGGELALSDLLPDAGGEGAGGT